jgi:WD40 repeat protein
MRQTFGSLLRYGSVLSVTMLSGAVFGCNGSTAVRKYDIAFIEQGPSPAHLRFMSADGALSPRVFLPNGMAVYLSGRTSLAWSPDGQRLAFAAMTGGSNLDIYTMKANGSELKRLTSNAARDEGVAWTPDGTRIAFLSNRHNVHEQDIYLVDVGTEAETRLTAMSGYYQSVAWSPDNSKLAYIRAIGGGTGDEVFLLDIASGTSTQVGTLPGAMLAQGLQWQPATNWFLFYAPGSFQDSYRYGTDGTNLRNLTGESSTEYNTQPSWYAGGQVLYYHIGATSADYSLWRMNNDGGGKSRIGNLEGAAWSPVYRFTTVDLPDLVVSSHSGAFDTSDPASPKYVVTFRVKNIGTGAGGATRVYVDGLDETPPQGQSPLRLQVPVMVASLASGAETEDLTAAFDVGQMHAKEVNLLRLTADPKAEVEEAFETNNQASRSWP